MFTKVLEQQKMFTLVFFLMSKREKMDRCDLRDIYHINSYLRKMK